MRINVYAEELPDLHGPAARRVERVSTKANTGVTFYGARLYLKSPEELHDSPTDDDRSAITIWGAPSKVAELLRELASAMDGTSP